MAIDVMAIITEAFIACRSFFSILMNSTGMTMIYLGIAFMCVVSRTLLAPLFGAALTSAGSDYARDVRSRYRARNDTTKALPPASRNRKKS